MLTIIHGNDTAQSRKCFLDERNKTKDAVLLDADQINLTDLAQILEGGGLFGETKFLFVEQFLTKRKKSSDFKDILSYLETQALENTIVLWEGKELERGALNEFKKVSIKIFKFPQTLFQLLDAIQPGNTKVMLNLFHQTIETAEVEMVYFMLVRQFRMLLALSETKTQTENPIDELKRIAPWQKGKLEKQANAFELGHLVNLYDKLFQIEVGQKTGGLSTPLVSTIDFFLLEV